jgi:hypothetical protein
MSNLNNRKALHPRWQTWALNTLSAFEACVIAIYDPNSEINGADYDPYDTENSTSAPTLLWEGSGQMQVFRQSLTVDDVAGSTAQVSSIRFTVAKDGPEMPVAKGLIVRVVECEQDPSLTLYEFTVARGINSGLAWKRTIEAEVDTGVLSDPITQAN